MVEFGLKLEDNKVADWGDRYIEYERLKAIVAKCSACVKKLGDLSQKRPEVAAAITEAHRNNNAGGGGFSGFSGGGPPATLHATTADADLTVGIDTTATTASARGMDGTISLQKINEESVYEEEPSERTELTPTSSFYGATAEGDDMVPVDAKGNLLSRAFGKAKSGVTDYFQKSFERTVRDTLKDIDAIADEFDECFHENINRVNTFYNNKLEELEGQLAYLKESVTHIRRASGVQQQQHSSDIDERRDVANDDSNETPLVRHRKSVSTTSPIAFAKAVARNLTSQMSRKSRSKSESSVALFADPYALLTGAAEGTTEEDATALLLGIGHADTAETVREADSVKRALVDHYRTAKLLSNFAIMNYTGFVKIVKKYDKTFPSDRRGRYKEEIAEANICNEGKAVEALADRMEKLYANWFCDRNVSEARAQMLTKKGDALEMDWSQLRLGYRMGMCSVLVLWVCWDCIWGLFSEGQSTIGGRTAFPVFRACGGLLMLQWCWGVSVWVWTRYRVNYIYLFDFNPSIVASPLVIFNEAVDNTLAYLVCSLLYYKAGAHAMPWLFPAGVLPFLLVIYTTYQLIFPLRTRAAMWNDIRKVVTAPMTTPSFFHGYIGDIFTSLVKVFQDLAWTVFFVLSGDWLISEDLKASTKHAWSKSIWYTNLLIPLVTLLPLWFRFNQCLRRYTDTGNRFPHLANAFKYALSQTVTLFGVFHPLYMRNNRESQVFQLFWMFAFIASSLYSFWWDLFMDWGLGQPKHKFLAPRLMFPKQAMYYLIICLDLVLRFAWVLTLLPPQSGAKFALPAYLTLVSMMLEIFRRTIWGFLRLENEHRSRTAGFRRVNFVPLHFSTGHRHEYKQDEAHRGFSVLLEVAAVTTLVLGAAVVSVVAAQRATLRSAGEL